MCKEETSSALGTTVTEVQVHPSAVVSPENGTQDSFFIKVLKNLHIIEKNPERPNNDFDSLSSGELAVYTAKQADGETFANGGQTRFYRPIDNYEGFHRFDPKAEWSKNEEKKIVRKV